jgi:RimJ/RimL family protein N-acetyltransferase
VIRAARLDLVLITPDLMRAILAADWPQAARMLAADIPQEFQAGDWQWLGGRPDRAEADPEVMAWLPRMLVLRDAAGQADGHRVVVGEAGFHGPPDDDRRVEIGYMMVTEHRRLGFAEEAVRALIGWAAADQGITRIRACVSPQNVASLNLVRKVGFIQVGSQQHERRGEELIFHYDAPA